MRDISTVRFFGRASIRGGRRARERAVATLMVALLTGTSGLALAASAAAAPPVDPAFEPIRVNAGGPEVALEDGSTPWGVDTPEESSVLANTPQSKATTLSTDAEISMPQEPDALITAPPELFQTARIDAEQAQPMRWTLAAPAGEYELHLYFAEIDPAVTSPGERVFDVLVDGDEVIDSLDVLATVGPMAALEQVIPVTSTGSLDIEFSAVAGAPLVSAISLELPAAAVAPGEPTTEDPSAEPSQSIEPSAIPSADPSEGPAPEASADPTVAPTPGPAATSAVEPSASPSADPMVSPTPEPSPSVTAAPEPAPPAKGPQARTFSELLAIETLAADAYSVQFSTHADRSTPALLDGATVAGDIFVFTGPDTDVSRVRFWVDNSAMSGTPTKTEGKAPYDLRGTNPDDTAIAWPTTGLTDGVHTVSAQLTTTTGTVTLQTSFTVANSSPALSATVSSWTASGTAGGLPSSTSVTVSAPAGTPTISAASGATWLTITPPSAAAPGTFTLQADPAGLASGTYATEATFSASGFVPKVVAVTFVVSATSSAYTFSYSTSETRSAPAPLDGATVDGSIYAFVDQAAGIQRVRFWVDNPAMSGTPDQNETKAPWDLEGGTVAAANPFDTSALTDGAHTITARIDRTNGAVDVLNAGITVANSTPALQVSAPAVSLTSVSASVPSTTVNLYSTAGGAGTYTATVSAGAPWLTVAPPSGGYPGTSTLTASPSGLAAGTYSATVTYAAGGLITATTTVTFTVVPVSSLYSVQYSLASNRSSAQPLHAATVSGVIYPFSTPTTGGITRVLFYVDDPTMTGAPFRIEKSAPYDLMGGTASAASPFDTAALPDGSHTVTARVELSTGAVEVAQSTFSVVNHALAIDPSMVSLNAISGGSSTSAGVTVSALDGGTPGIAASDDATWLSTTLEDGTAPTTMHVTANPTGLAEGSYSATVTVTASGYSPATLSVVLTVGADNAACYPLACEQLLADIPTYLEFNEDWAGILDGNGVGTGFTYVQPTTNGSRYLPENLEVDLLASELHVTTTAGLQSTTSNSMDNALGVGIDAPSQITRLQVTVDNVPAGTKKYEQAGLWYGLDEDNYVKLTVQSAPSAPRIEFLAEIGGVHVQQNLRYSTALPGKDVSFRLIVNPYTRTITALYSTGGAFQTLASYDAPLEMFSFDAAGIDPRIGTRSFGGVMASHRNATAPLTYTFSSFSVTEEETAAAATPYEFTPVSASMMMPTAMAWGPDDRLYVTGLFGDIHAFTYDANWNVVAEQVITSLGTRLTLGLTIDPASTPTDVRLVVAHSSPSLDAGEVNSSTVTELSGPGFSTVTDLITGLPRALANHAINNIHFGTDGRLYIAIGGNTGAGAPNLGNSEFGDRPEQPLSAALLVADVYGAGFEGACATPLYQFGVPATCDVQVFSSGLRNTYDFVEHSNGHIYGPDNGLGVLGTYPPSPTAPCTGLSPVSNNPGSQFDELNLLEEGKYYGHPNPYRNECVFKDGAWQAGAVTPTNYETPVQNLGNNRSANGIVEYRGTAFCGELDGVLLIANYSVGDNITYSRLSADGRSVVETGVLIEGLSDPLPLTMGPNGVLFVGEFGDGRITVLAPSTGGCWGAEAAVPEKLLDSAGAAIGTTAYMVGGKTAVGPVSSMYAYDTVSDTWSTAASLPGAAVENPAVVASGGLLYAFGGSTAPFSGAVANAAVYNPATDSWTSLASMPTARGGATASVLDGVIYVSGGMGTNGASVATVEAYAIATGTWSTVASLSTARDNAGSAAVNGRLYVFGGRTRLADGTQVNGTLASMQVFNPATGTWSSAPSMITGRRTFAVGTLGGKIQAVGGEAQADGTAFGQNEEFDPVTNTWRSLPSMPTPRHGAAAATVGDEFHVMGGGVVAGFSVSDLHEVFRRSAG